MKYPLIEVVFLGALAVVPAAAAQNTSTMVTEWSQITPSADITWTPCFLNFTCARLLVPLDYEDSSVGTAAIAMVKVAAQNETKETKSILVNPGGPGQSGTEYVMNAPSFFRSFSGPDYNIIGFDPRGVAFSEPNLDCFHGNKALAVNWAQSMSNLIPVASTEELNAMYELTGAYGDLCGQKLNATASYVGTPVVARDMLTIAEKLAVASGGKKEDAVLNLLAASYGSALGATFATLFPDRVGRFVLDAIVDGEDYYDNERITAMLDVDEAAKAFFTLCNKAGSERCAFYEDSAEKIEERYQKLLAAIKEHPIAVWDDKITQIPSLATSKQLKQVFYQTLRASSQFPTFAQILLDLEKRNGTSLLRSAGTPCYDCEDTKLAIQTVIPMVPPGGMIACVDTDGRGNLSTLGAWKEHVDAEVKASAYAGDVWAHYTLDCRKWPFRSPPSQRFNGKFGANTKTPLFILNNRIDPATPLRSAHKLNALFNGSILLTQEGIGHGAVLDPSDCTTKYIRAYLESGMLPPANTTCQPNAQPFGV